MMTLPKSIISLRDVDVHHGDIRLNAVTLDVPEHSRFALLGLPDSGKTTIVKILAGLVKISTGTGRVLDYVLHTPQIASDKAIGFLHQSVNWPGSLTVSEFIHLFTERHSQDPLSVQTDELVALAGLQGREFVAGDQLSAKERQLAGLIALHARDPSLLILDDPTGGLNPGDRRAVLDVIERISAGRTIFFTTSYATDVQNIATHAAVLHQGTILMQGTSDSVFTWPHAAVYRIELRGDSRIVYEHIRNLTWVREIIEQKNGDRTVWTIWLHNDVDVPSRLLRAILADRGLKVVQLIQVRPPVDSFLTELAQVVGDNS